MPGKLISSIRKALKLLASPVERARTRERVVLQPYRGYGSAREIFLIGRVFDQPTFGANAEPNTLWRHILAIGRRLLRRGIADATVEARFGGATESLRTDKDGYFRLHLEPVRPPPADRLWHEVELRLQTPSSLAAKAHLFIPPSHCRYVVISDIDDTIMHTGVAQKITMLWRLFMQGSKSRIAFPGMAGFLQALHGGRSAAEYNPMLYVSRAPWSIYDVLDQFFQLHHIPVGPILFLREWGLTLQSPLPRRAKGHKLELIRHMLQLYRELPFILVGDSGQRDPEIYAQVIREHPGRVLAIYIRDVSRASERRRAIEELALEITAAGSSLVLAADSFAMARHAAERGLIDSDGLARVLSEQADEGARVEAQPSARVTRPSAEATHAAVAAGELGRVLDENARGAERPSVVVEATAEPQPVASSGPPDEGAAAPNPAPKGAR